MPQDPSTNPIIKSATRVLDTDSENTAFAYTASGIYSGAYLTGVSGVAVQNGQTAVITFYGKGADNDTFSCQIWSRSGIGIKAAGGDDGAYMLQYVGLATVTLSTITGIAGSSVITTAYRIADTITWTPATTATTPSGNFTDLAGALGTLTGTASSPANNTPATLILPILGEGQELVFDFDLTGTSTAANALCQVNVI